MTTHDEDGKVKTPSLSQVSESLRLLSREVDSLTDGVRRLVLVAIWTFLIVVAFGIAYLVVR